MMSFTITVKPLRSYEKRAEVIVGPAVETEPPERHFEKLEPRLAEMFREQVQAAVDHLLDVVNQPEDPAVKEARLKHQAENLGGFEAILGDLESMMDKMEQSTNEALETAETKRAEQEALVQRVAESGWRPA
jgi:hypothetical protein